MAMTMTNFFKKSWPTDVILTFYSVSCYQCRSIDILKERGLLTSENFFKDLSIFGDIQGHESCKYLRWLLSDNELK